MFVLCGFTCERLNFVKFCVKLLIGYYELCREMTLIGISRTFELWVGRILGLMHFVWIRLSADAGYAISGEYFSE